MRHLAPRLASVPGVVAVALGGSRATGEATERSDWDFGLYYRGTIDPDDVRALGFEGRVFGPYEWGRIVNGGAWLTIDGERVDLIYRELDVVEAAVADAEAGRFRIEREVGHAAGIPTYVLAGELAANEVLVGSLPRPSFPPALREAAPAVWRNLVGGALKFALHHAWAGDVVACAAELSVAVLQEGHARLAERGEWALGEKRLAARAGLDDAHRLLSDLRPGVLVDRVEEVRALLSA